MYDITLFEELSKFDDVTYYDEPHKYYFSGSDQPLTSGTQLISRYSPFDREGIATKQSQKTGRAVEDILLEWDSSGVKGTCVHEYTENILANKIFPYPEHTVNSQLGDVVGNQVKGKFYRTIPLVDKFRSDIAGKLINIRSELVMGDRDYWVGGMIDQVFFNKKSGMLELWDWKTNKKIDTYSKYNLSNELSHLDKSKLTIYSLQLSLYKHILEKNTNLKLGDSYICWFNENNDNYHVYKCHDLQNEVKIMLDVHMKERNELLYA